MTSMTTLSKEQVDEIFAKITILLDSIMVSDVLIRHELRIKLNSHEELTVELLAEMVESSARTKVANDIREIMEQFTGSDERKIIEIRKRIKESSNKEVSSRHPVARCYDLAVNNEWKHILLILLSVEDPECFA